jgi:hypothetical protein
MRSHYLFLIQFAVFFISYSGYVEWNNVWVHMTFVMRYVQMTALYIIRFPTWTC